MSEVDNKSTPKSKEKQTMPERIWLFQLPDGHWEIRWKRPEVPATEYVKVKSL